MANALKLLFKSRIFLFVVLMANIYFAKIICIDTNGLEIIDGSEYLVILMIYFLTEMFVFAPSSFKIKHIIRLLYYLNLSILLISLFHIEYHEWEIHIVIFDILEIKIKEFEFNNFKCFMEVIKIMNYVLLLNFVFIETFMIYKLLKQNKSTK
jgi:hypothetical protein